MSTGEQAHPGPPNGLELRVASPEGIRAASPWDPELARGSCPAAQATAHSFSRILAGKAPLTFRTPAGSAAASCCATRTSVGVCIHSWERWGKVATAFILRGLNRKTGARRTRTSCCARMTVKESSSGKAQ